MKSLMFCLLGAAVGTAGLMAFDTAALSRSGTSAQDSGWADTGAERQLSADSVMRTSDGRKVRVVYPAR